MNTFSRFQVKREKKNSNKSELNRIAVSVNFFFDSGVCTIYELSKTFISTDVYID